MLVKAQAPVDDMVARTFPLEQFDEAFQMVLESRGSIKAMLKP